MTFVVSNQVTLLFDFWNVDGPAGKLQRVKQQQFLETSPSTGDSFQLSMQS